MTKEELTRFDRLWLYLNDYLYSVSPRDGEEQREEYKTIKRIMNVMEQMGEEEIDPFLNQYKVVKGVTKDYIIYKKDWLFSGTNLEYEYEMQGKERERRRKNEM